MTGHAASFGIGLVAGMRTLTAGAALVWLGSGQPGRPGAARPLAWLRGLAVAGALSEMAGDKLPFAPDRRIAPSFAVRLALGAAGGALLAGPGASRLGGAVSGVSGAVVGTVLGRAARGATTRSRADLARALTEDAAAAGLAAALVRATRADRAGWPASRLPGR